MNKINGSRSQTFIDRFFVPQKAKSEFNERMNINRKFLRKQSGFLDDHVYERMDENGDFHFVTIAEWENDEAIKNAKKAVQAEYEREGFDMPGMLKRLDILLDRGVYENIAD